MCKTSTLVNMTGRSTPAKSPSGDGLDEPQWMVDRSERESWEDDIIDCDGKYLVEIMECSLTNIA